MSDIRLIIPGEQQDEEPYEQEEFPPLVNTMKNCFNYCLVLALAAGLVTYLIYHK